MSEPGSSSLQPSVCGSSAAKPKLLILSDEPWWSSSLESIFVPSGYRVEKSSWAHLALAPLDDDIDAVLLHVHDLGDATIDLCSRLRSMPDTGPLTPVVVVSDHPLSREQRIRVLRAGAWECLAPPLDAEALVLKLETYVAARRATVCARDLSLLDQLTGFYNARGIMHWINELGQTAQRHQRPLACAVFEAPVDSTDSLSPHVPSSEQIQQLVELFGSIKRASDIVGRLSYTEFAVIAPETDSEGIQAMVARYMRALQQQAQAAGGQGKTIVLRAGCYGVADFSTTSIEPMDILTRANAALRRTYQGGGGDVGFYQGVAIPN